MRMRLMAQLKKASKVEALEKRLSKDLDELLTVAKILKYEYAADLSAKITRAIAAGTPTEDSSEEVENEYGAAWDSLKDAVFAEIKSEDLAKEILAKL